MKRIFLLLLLVVFAGIQVSAKDFVIEHGKDVRIAMPEMERPVAETALEMLSSDMEKVLGSKIHRSKTAKKANIVLSINANLPHEGFQICVTDGRLHMAGADEHGLAYGLLELSRLMGVSPWEYWADCTPRPIDRFALPESYRNEQSPAVEYRGIFINDEDWGLNPWATRQEPEAWTIHKNGIKGAIGPRVNEKIFQLMLRLRANYYWPAMHECSQPFFSIDGNREMAAKYGIYVGGSHCEPMATSPAAEWGISGNGDYNYVTNSDAVKSFWQRRLDDVKNQEIVYTLGMRGVHDGSMQGVKTMDDKRHYLQMVLDDQREMLRRSHPQGLSVPQVFVPYKEVLDIYRSGLNVPDDITLMWTDDNYGYIRHFPDSIERSRKGGNGVYYHVSYWGRPHDYLWLNSLSPDLLQSEMMTAYDRGIRKMWILNVGDIKPSEYQIELFMQLAWDGKSIPFIEHFVKREFGSSTSATVFGESSPNAIIDVLRTYFRLSAEMKPEHMGGTRVEESDKAYWNQIHPILGDWTKERIAKRIADYQAISDKVEQISEGIPSDRRDAFFQLVKYPVQAAAQMNFKFLRPERCLEAYDSIQALTRYYNKVCAGGKWDGIMDASPRRLPVFQKVQPEQLPTYPDKSEWMELGFDHRHTRFDAPSPYLVNTPLGTDSITIRVHLRPSHPIKDGRLSFRLEADGNTTEPVEYQTYDRSEEWKQNVIRGYAVRDVRIAIDPTKTEHGLFFIPASPGVKLFSLFQLNNSPNK